MDISIYLYPELQAYRQGRLQVDGVHSLYWEECGNPAGVPVLFLHGGPGGRTSPRSRRYFDPSFYRIVLFDQRGAGLSTPAGETQRNTTALLIQDIEALRQMLGVEQWLIFGGSWGVTLGLAYGQSYPQHCLGFVLRGVFLGTREEVEWFMDGPRRFFPEAWAALVQTLPPGQRNDPWPALIRGMAEPGGRLYAQAWAAYEEACAQLVPQPTSAEDADEGSVSLGRLEAHYLSQQCFLEPDQLMNELARVRHLPCRIVQGRYDLICPPATAFALHQAWPNSVLTMVPDAGHAAREPGIEKALVAATDAFRSQLVLAPAQR